MLSGSRVIFSLAWKLFRFLKLYCSYIGMYSCYVLYFGRKLDVFICAGIRNEWIINILIILDETELHILIQALQERVNYAGSLLVKQLKKRDALKSKQEKICNVITAHLQANSFKSSKYNFVVNFCISVNIFIFNYIERRINYAQLKNQLLFKTIYSQCSINFTELNIKNELIFVL